MASSKDTFEQKTFAANSFASGTWRGIGVDIETVTGCIVASGVYQPGVQKSEVYQGGSQAGQAGCS